MWRFTCLAAIAALACGPLAGCGGGSSTHAGGAGAASSLSGAAQGSASGEAVADVAGTPIAMSAYRHWTSVESALGVSKLASRQALGFLITSQWVLGEAAARHLDVSDGEARARLETLARKELAKSGGLRALQAKSKETTTDLLGRVKVELLESKIAQQVTAGTSAARRKAVLASFQREFERRWRGRTSCRAAYVMEDCSQYKGPRAPGTAAAGSGGTSASGASGASGASSRSGASGEVYSAPGGMSIGSTEFERNGPVPARYTCDGAGISPALQWQNVPAHTAELVLFVIDDGSNGSDGGIRWVLGGIDPSTHGVAAGQTPAGAIVGRNTAGKVGYSAICPRKGQTHTIEFVMYALKKKIALTSGFEPAIAESEYGGSTLASAVNYGVYTRR